MGKMKRRVAILGAGRMGSALARGFVREKLLDPDRIVAADVDGRALENLRKDTGVRTVSENARAAEEGEILILALKPDKIQGALKEIKDRIGPKHLIVSIAAGVTIRTIESVVGPGRRIIRVMPNTPCLIGAGASAFSAGDGATREDREDVNALLGAVGTVVELPEVQLDAVTGLSGSGPAYGFMIIDALAEGGVRMGLSRPTAMELAAQTLLGAAQLVQTTKKSPGELIEQVKSPGGTTVAGLAALEAGGLRETLIKAVEAATKRSVELGKKSAM